MDTIESVALCGATGQAGSAILTRLLEAGFRVRALARTPSKLPEHHGLTVVEGDITNPHDVMAVMDGVDAVVSAVGPSPSHPQLCHRATANILGALSETTVRRYAVVSGASVKLPTDRRNVLGTFMAYVLPLVDRVLMEDKVKEASLLVSSDVDWTLIRCPMIRDGAASGGIGVDMETPRGMSVTTGNLAAFVVDLLTKGTYVRQAPFVYG